MTEQFKPLQYTVRQTTDEEFAAKMPYVTSSMVEAVNTCPRWGIVHNVLGKRFTTGYRQMALEAGSLMHDVFACLNFLHVGIVQKLPDHMHHHAKQNFGISRWNEIWRQATEKHGPDLTINSINALERLVITCIATSDYYDDPDDRNRTISNLERCALELLQYWLMNLCELPIYIKDRKRPEAPIGIEMSLDCVFEITDKSEGEKLDGGGSYSYPIKRIRAIGLADVVYQNPDTLGVSLGEYKTASSMNEAWHTSFMTRHQITLYPAMMQAYFGMQEQFNVIMVGSAIPVRSTTAPVQHFQIDRDQENVHELLTTFQFTQDLIKQFTDNALSTPMFTHSCNRYFRTCSLMDLCTAAKDDQYIMLEDMQIAEEKSPSEMKAFLRNI